MRSYIKSAINPEQSWTIPDLLKTYCWPTNAQGGAIIGIIELGGGWNQSDLDMAFSRMGLPLPIIVNVSVDGTQNTPGSDADAEVALDIQVAAAAYSVATGHAANIRMYWTQDMALALEQAANDGCAVFSMSWGAPEEEWGDPAVYQMNSAAGSAWRKGMVSIAAAGDNDADDGQKAPSVDCPACCPQVLGCGGTTKPVTGPETVWNNNPGRSNGRGTGGGYSRYFPRQGWQLGAPASPIGLGRMIPDVAANADPNTGYEIVLNGQVVVVGGTSAVAPLYAGLIAAVYGPHPGWILPRFYSNPKWFTDITSGANGTYAARVGPDPCTGLGAPIANLIGSGSDGH